MIDTILDIVCLRHEISRSEIAVKKGRRQVMKTVAAKQEAAYLLKKFTTLTNMQVAVMLGYPEKQIVNASVKQIIKITAGNKAYRAELEKVETAITNNETYFPVFEPIHADTTYYLKNTSDQYFTLDKNRKLITTDKPTALIIGPEPSDCLKLFYFTGNAAKILRLVCNTYGSHTDCILCYGSRQIVLNFSNAIDHIDHYSVSGRDIETYVKNV